MATATLAPGAVGSLQCPSCGAAIVLRAMAWTQTVACASCGAVLDARDPHLRILQRFEERITLRPLIPLGTRGEWRGAPYEAVGVQQRTITVEGTPYSWREYLLFNPYRGFRYLTEYDGHWNDVVPLQTLPEPLNAGGGTVLRHDGRTYRHFQTARATTTFVLGEFPWEVRTGDEVTTRDYVAPPHVISAEDDAGETTWSIGEYVDGRAIWRAFELPGSPPSPHGIYANQPSPLGSIGGMWKTFVLLALLLLAALGARSVAARNERVFHGAYDFQPGHDGPAFVTAAFDLEGSTGNVVLETSTDVENQWMYVAYALIDEASGQTYDVGREISRYSGRDSDGNWTEGSPRDRARIGPVPAGRYFLRVEPSGGDAGRPIHWEIDVRRDVPSPRFFLLALIVLAIPPIVVTARGASFETRRWAESDHAAPNALASLADDA